MTLVEFLGIFDYFSKAEALRNHQVCPPKNGRNEEKICLLNSFRVARTQIIATWWNGIPKKNFLDWKIIFKTFSKLSK